MDSVTLRGPFWKNKGLTPKRSKSVRNPRVRKDKNSRRREEVGIAEAIYKGGVDVGRYGGEESGISKVVKSTRL